MGMTRKWTANLYGLLAVLSFGLVLIGMYGIAMSFPEFWFWLVWIWCLVGTCSLVYILAHDFVDKGLENGKRGDSEKKG